MYDNHVQESVSRWDQGHPMGPKALWLPPWHMLPLGHVKEKEGHRMY